MALTYTEVAQEKSIRIWVFFAVVLLFYFIVAVILGNIAKAFFALNAETAVKISPFLTQKQLLNLLLFALFAAVIHTIYSVNNAMPLITRNLAAQNADPSDKYHERFKKIVDEVNVATGSKYKITSIVIPTVAMNAFAISDHKKNAVIGVTEGLLFKLNRQQLEAVVAHECGHIVSGDSFQTTVGCALFGIYAAILAGLGKILKGGRMRSSGKSSGGIVLFILLIYATLSVMQFFYNLIRLFVSRDRELRADAIAVKLTRDPISLSEALYSISRGWRGMDYIDRNLESIFIINPVREAVDERQGLFADLLSTHPPVNQRMAILADMAHADVKNIEERVIAQEKLRDISREDTKQEGPRWMIMDDAKGWVGPFTISQMMVADVARPDSWIKSFSGDVMKQAKDEPFLTPLFNNKIRGLSTTSFNCPQCSQPLIEEEYEGAKVNGCVFCGGVLVNRERLPRIIIREEKDFSEEIKKIAEMTQKDGLRRMRDKIRPDDKSYLKCPKCGISMIRGFYTMAYLVEVDKCESCSVVWFDKDELEILQYLIENKKSGLLK